MFTRKYVEMFWFLVSSKDFLIAMSSLRDLDSSSLAALLKHWDCEQQYPRACTKELEAARSSRASYKTSSLSQHLRTAFSTILGSCIMQHCTFQFCHMTAATICLLFFNAKLTLSKTIPYYFGSLFFYSYQSKSSIFVLLYTNNGYMFCTLPPHSQKLFSKTWRYNKILFVASSPLSVKIITWKY